MSDELRSLRGMKDRYGDQMPYWQHCESCFRQLMLQYSYQELRTPLLENTALFSRSIGAETDIVSKEMYTFLDRNEQSITLRPEGTAGCVRAGIQNGLFYNQKQRWWYTGQMFRYERPQKGRYREFSQLGLEAYGFAGVGIELEILLLTWRFLCQLGLQDQVQLEINHLGSAQSRAVYVDKLVTYLRSHQAELDEDSQRRLDHNPLRILDSKNSATQAILQQAPSLLDELTTESQVEFDLLQSGLQKMGVSYIINSRLVRGLDYYNGLVFEWTTPLLGAQSAVCAGGRYDQLVSRLGGPATPAIGFACGLERLILLLQQQTQLTQQVDVSVMLLGQRALVDGMVLVESLRDQLPNLSCQVNVDQGSLKSQFKRANAVNAAFALIIGDNELDESLYVLKDLRQDGHEQRLTATALQDVLGRMSDSDASESVKIGEQG